MPAVSSLHAFINSAGDILQTTMAAWSVIGRLLISFKINFFEKFFQEYHQCQTARTQNRPDFYSCLVCHWSRSWVIFHAFWPSADFFQNQLFRKILSGIPSECQTAWTQIRPDILSGLIWVQTVCTGYQQTTLSML